MKGEGYFGKIFVKGEDYWYTAFRVVIGLVFLLHGLSKFGVFSKMSVALGSLMGVAGVIETVVGVLIILGLWTRLVAFIGAIEMIVAWFIAHVPHGWDPLQNGGEAALLFFVVFLVLLIHGGGKYTLEHWMKKKELF